MLTLPCKMSCLQGWDVAKKAVLEFLDTFKQPVAADDREILRMVARTSLRTKLTDKLADQLTDIVTDAVLAIRKPDEPLDLHMVGSFGLKVELTFVVVPCFTFSVSVCVMPELVYQPSAAAA